MAEPQVADILERADAQALRRLVDQGGPSGPCLRSSDPYLLRPLAEWASRSCERGDTATLQLLLDAGMDVNMDVSTGSDLPVTLLAQATRRADGSMMKFLLERGASATSHEIQAGFQEIPLAIALAVPKGILFDFLVDEAIRCQNVKAGPGRARDFLQLDERTAPTLQGYLLGLMDSAAARGDTAEFESLWRGGGRSIVARSFDPTTSNALSPALCSDNTRILAHLLDVGIPPNQPDDEGFHAIHAAARLGAVESIGLLIERGSDPNQRDASGNTPAHVAAWACQSEALWVLHKHGADLNAIGAHGWTPLGLRMRTDPLVTDASRKTIRTLACLGARLDDPPSAGDSPEELRKILSAGPLMNAVRTYDKRLVAQCLSNIQDVQDPDFKAAMSWIKTSRAKDAGEVRALMQAHGAKLAMAEAIAKGACARKDSANP